MVSIKLLCLTCLYRFLQKIYGPFYHSKRENSSQSSVTAGCFAAVDCFVFFLNSIISVYCVFSLQPHVQPIHSSATATCVLTTPWCAMGFRTVFTLGMKTTAKVIIFSLRLPVSYYG